MEAAGEDHCYPCGASYQLGYLEPVEMDSFYDSATCTWHGHGQRNQSLRVGRISRHLAEEPGDVARRRTASRGGSAARAEGWLLSDSDQMVYKATALGAQPAPQR